MSVIYRRAQYDAPDIGADMARHHGPTELFIHHTADAEGYSYNTKAEQVAKIHSVDKQHRSQGWAMCGYHWMIFQQTGSRKLSRAYQVRPGIYVPSAQAGHNTDTIAVCVVGNGMKEPLHSDTVDAIRRIVWMYNRLETVGGHRDVVATSCPGDRMYGGLDRVADATRLKRYKVHR